MELDSPLRNANPQASHHLKIIEFDFLPISCVAKNASNSLLAVARDRGNYVQHIVKFGDVEIWDPQSMCYLKTIHNAGAFIRSMAFVNDDFLLVASLDGVLRGFSVGNGEKLFEVASNGGPIWSISLHRAHKSAALACEDGTVRLFRVEHPRDVHLEGTLQSNDQCRLVSVHWDQADTVWAGSDGCVYGWNINQNANAPKLLYMPRGVENRRKSNTDWKETNDLQRKVDNWVWSLVCTSNQVIAGTQFGEILVWNKKSLGIIQVIQKKKTELSIIPPPILALALSKNEDTLISTGVSTEVVFYSIIDANRWIYRKYNRIHTHDVNALVLVESKEHPHTTFCVTGGADSLLVRTNESFKSNRFNIDAYTVNNGYDPDFKPLSQGRVVIVYQKFTSNLAISERLPSPEMPEEIQRYLDETKNEKHVLVRRRESLELWPIPTITPEIASFAVPEAPLWSFTPAFSSREELPLTCSAISTDGFLFACSNGVESKVWAYSLSSNRRYVFSVLECRRKSVPYSDRIAGSTLPGAVQLAFNGTQLILLTNRAGASGSELVVYDLISMQQLQSCSVTMPDFNDNFHSESKDMYHYHLAIREGKYLVTYGDKNLSIYSLKNGQIEIKKNISFASSIAAVSLHGKRNFLAVASSYKFWLVNLRKMKLVSPGKWNDHFDEMQKNPKTNSAVFPFTLQGIHFDVNKPQLSLILYGSRYILFLNFETSEISVLKENLPEKLNFCSFIGEDQMDLVLFYSSWENTLSKFYQHPYRQKHYGLNLYS